MRSHARILAGSIEQRICSLHLYRERALGCAQSDFRMYGRWSTLHLGGRWLACLVLSIGGPPAVLLAVVAIGLRIRRHSPRAAVALVALPPILIAGVAAASVMGFAGY